MVINELQWGAVQMYNTTLTCRAAAVPPPVSLVAETAYQLQLGIRLLGQLQPFTITLAQDMTVPAPSWPTNLTVNVSMVLAGLPPPATRIILDLYQVHGTTR